MAIRIPTERTYYQSSPTEPDYLLCWIPKEELKEMVMNGQANRDVLENYPYGLEIEVDEEALQEAEIDLKISPEKIHKAYALLRRQGLLDDSGYVQGAALESFAKHIEERTILRTATVPSELQSLPKPKMSDGDEPSVIFQSLTAKGGK